MRAFDLTEETKKVLNTPEFRRLLTPGLMKIRSIYEKNGKELRIVGGAVRDLILGKEPKDIDLATDATPLESLEMLVYGGVRVIETGLAHGTITAIADGEEFEITTLRIDVATDGRHAEVEFTTDWEIDAERRDLTFNAMSLDLDGTLYDYFNGLEDLKANKAKFVGQSDKRIQEDYLRILRYFRFQGRMPSLDFDKKTMKSISKNASGLIQISGQRIWMEIKKILSGNHTEELIKAIRKTKVGKYIGLPNKIHTSINQIKNMTDNPATILSTFLQNEDDVNGLVERWNLNNNERDLIKFIVRNRDRSLDLNNVKDMSTNPKIHDNHILELLNYLGRNDIKQELERWNVPTFPVAGKDLIAMGMKPNPQFGKILQDLERKWKDSGYIMTKDDLLNLLVKKENVEEGRFYDVEEYMPTAEVISELSRYIPIEGKLVGAIIKHIDEKYGDEVARMFHMLMHISHQSDFHPPSVNRMINLIRWRDTRDTLADNIYRIKNDIEQILSNPTKRRALELGLRIVK